MLYSDEELVEYEAKHGKQTDIKRYKGLGALNPSDTERYLLSDERKISKVTMDNLDEMKELFSTFLGKTTEDGVNRSRLVGEGYVE